MKKRHMVTITTLNIVFDANKKNLLLIKYADTKGHLAGRCNVPWWHIEKGEDVLWNARKEIKEEADIDVEDLRLAWVVHVSDFFWRNVMMFVTESISKEMKTHRSHEWETIWAPIEEVKKYKIFADVLPIVEILKKDPKNCFSAHSLFDGKWELLSFTLHENW